MFYLLVIRSKTKERRTYIYVWSKIEEDTSDRYRYANIFFSATSKLTLSRAKYKVLDRIYTCSIFFEEEKRYYYCY